MILSVLMISPVVNLYQEKKRRSYKISESSEDVNRKSQNHCDFLQQTVFQSTIYDLPFEK